MRLTAGQIATLAGGAVLAGDPDALATSWDFDSRALRPGACFVALKNHRDGHDFVGEAFRAGARVAVVERPVLGIDPTGSRALVRVPDVIKALQAVARAVRRERADLKVVGVAGSTGKTSTKDLLAAALPPGTAYASPESYNNEFGLPITLLNTPSAARGVIAEMGERFAGDISLLCEIAQPQYGLVTNVGLAHAEHLGGPEGVAAVLGELLDALPASGVAVLNADDPWTARLGSRAVAAVETVGFSADADHRITDAEIASTLHASFSLAGCRFRIGLRGAHQAINAGMAAIAAHRAFDTPIPDIAKRMATARGSSWRMELLEAPDGVVVLNDSYNANPASMEAALRALAQLDVAGRRIAVLGDMRELGTHSARAHAAVGQLAGELGTDVLVGVGDGGAEIVEAAHDAVRDSRVVKDAEEATSVVLDLARPGDAVLVKASRAIGLQLVAERLLRREAAP